MCKKRDIRAICQPHGSSIIFLIIYQMQKFLYCADRFLHFGACARHYRTVQCFTTDTVIAGVESVLEVPIPTHLWATISHFTLLYLLPLAFPNIFISSLLPSDISIALLVPHRLRGELEHMCVCVWAWLCLCELRTFCGCFLSMWPWRGPNRCRLNGYEWSCE